MYRMAQLKVFETRISFPSHFNGALVSLAFGWDTKHRSCTGSYSPEKGTAENKLGQTHFESRDRASPKQAHHGDTGQQGNHKHAADSEHTHRSKCPDFLGGLFTHWSCRKAVQTQQNSLPTPPVAFYRKMLKAVASVIFDSPWVAITCIMEWERFCRNTNRYNRQRHETRCFLSGHISLHACFHGMHFSRRKMNLFCSTLHFVCLHLFPSFVLLMYFHFISKCSALHRY